MKNLIKILCALLFIVVVIVGINKIVKDEGTEDYTKSSSDEAANKSYADYFQGNINFKDSTPTEPLSVGEWGIASAYAIDGENVIMGVFVDNIFTDEDATALIEKFGGRKTIPTTQCH